MQKFLNNILKSVTALVKAILTFPKLLYNYLKKQNEFSLNRSSLQILTLKNGDTISYCRFGKGAPIILIMGYFCTIAAWDIRLLYELSKHFEVIVYNNRNTSLSNSISTSYTIEDLALDLKELILGLNLKVPIIAGISMGGMIAQRFASLYPDQLSHLVLITTLPPGEKSILPSSYIQDILRHFRRNSLRSYLAVLMILFPSMFSIINIFIYRLRARGNTTIAPEETILNQQALIEEWTKNYSIQEILLNIEVPTLILGAKLDEITLVENCDVLHKYISNSKIVIYKDAGHGLIFQYPTQIARDIISNQQS